ncbi:MAG TPA: hypothetical protein VIG74_06385, partial [Alphaproteobacteria bacterium]
QNVSLLLKPAMMGQGLSKHLKNIEKIVECHIERHAMDVEIRAGQCHIVLPANCDMGQAHALMQELNTLVDSHNRPVLEAEISFFSNYSHLKPA